MKETKKATTKKTSTRSTAKSTTKPKVKDIEIEDNFLDEEETDKRLVVFAVIAVLVILAIIVTLVIGCDRKKEEQNKKPVDDIVVPDKKDDKDEDEDDGVETKEIVRKVASVYRGTKTKESDKSKKKKKDTIVEDPTTYNVTYYIGEDSEVKEVEEGKKAEKYVPTGYSSCKYYTTQNFTEETEEFDFDKKIKKDVNLYLSCEIITYHVVYDNGNTTDYTVDGEDITIEDELYDWYTEDTYENKVTVINKDFVANENNITEKDGEYYIYLFGKEKEAEPECEGTDCDVDPTQDPETPGTTYGSACTENCTEETEGQTEEIPEGQVFYGQIGAEEMPETTEPAQTDAEEVPGEEDEMTPGETVAVPEEDEEEEQIPETTEPVEPEPEKEKEKDVAKPAETPKPVKEEPSKPAPAAPAAEKETENKTEDNSGEEKPEEGSEE